MTGSERPADNPYIGPRPFEIGETMYGRDREVTELLYRLSAERIVLLHSPSGAGKSSLIQAGLIPRLRERFDVWRPTRVSHPLPIGVPVNTNRHVLSAMLGLEQGIPESLRRSAAQLGGLRLSAYVEGRPRRPSALENTLLIFDQFEEILTVDPLELDAKNAFFAELAEVLQHPQIWALFSLREDYLAQLDPYARMVPTHFIHRYRIDLLGLEAAREAMIQPVRPAGRTWAEDAVDKLIRDLAMVKLQQADGSFAEQTGRHIEPMHLQVVCRGLWDSMAAEEIVVTVADIAAFGDVTEALGNYYAAEVRRIADDDERTERTLRTWIKDHLFTAEGVRTPVLRTAKASEGLDNVMIERLVDAHLVRADHRGGAVWYELAHDRLVKPVRDDNERWELAHLQPMQVQATLWVQRGKPPGLLLSAEALAEAEQWVAAQSAPPQEPDLSFLAASRVARVQEQALRTAQQRFVRAVTILGLLAIVAAGVSLWQWRKAERFAWEVQDQKTHAELKEHEAREQAKKADQAAKEAIEARAAAEYAKVRAEENATAAKEARMKAEKAREENEKLLQHMFRAALKGLIANLAKASSISGEVEVADKEVWTPLLEKDGQYFAAATAGSENLRIIVAGNDTVLNVASKLGSSLFLEMASRWLLEGKDRKHVAIFSENKAPRRLMDNLRFLQYAYSLNPPLAELKNAGMVILDNRQAGFTGDESAAITDFIRGGGGVLAVGNGWSWARKKRKLEEYPMNELFEEFKLSWSDKPIEGLEKLLPPDTDKDGIPDSLDKCEEHAGVPPHGCPLDPDNDGFQYANDWCPTTPGSNNGCPEPTAPPPKAAIAPLDTYENPEVQFTLGQTAYALTNYDRAAWHFMRSFELSGHPELLFNIGLSYFRWYDLSANLDHLNKARQMFENFGRASLSNAGLTNAQAMIMRVDEKIAAHLAKAGSANE